MFFKRFCQDRRASVLPLFAVVAVPLVAVIGAAIDYSRTSSVRTEMQAALDATALMLSKETPGQADTALTAKANDYFQALYSRPEAKNVIISAGGSGSTDNATLTVKGTGTLATRFSGLLGFSSIDFAGSSTVQWGSARLRVSLVLDNTGSMAAAGKMGALKTAAHNLLTQLQTAAKNTGDVYVSIVPFADVVNVDPINRNETWVRWDLWEEVNGACSNSAYTTKTACTAGLGIWTAADRSTWSGCVTDRDQNYDTTSAAPSTLTAGTLFPAEQAVGKCPAPLMGLSYSWPELHKKIDDMEPKGTTNQAIGLQWGFQSLTSAPLTVPSVDALYKYRQIIILFTDGMNTKDRWYTDAASIDARQKITCENVKTAGIVLYTVQVTTDADPVSTMLQNCATADEVDPKGPKFFFLTSGSQIVTTFNQIGTSLAKLRISK